MESLDEISEGRYRVATASGTQYEVDLDRHTLARRPDCASAEPNYFRRDLELVKLLSVETCRIGECALFLIDLQLRGVAFTARRSTEVWSIELLPPGADNAALIAEFDDLIAGWGELPPGAG